jgi:hypothetical protein
MSLKKSLAVVLLISFWIFKPGKATAQDFQGALSAAIQEVDVKEISRYFDKRVQVTIDQESNYYSNTQAEIIIRNFLANMGRMGFISSNTEKRQGEMVQLFTGTITSAKGNYRTSILVRRIGQTKVIQEVHFQKQ